ncbi:MAG TPA: alkaline phosphatase PhoX [Vicinamibacteria bacterium]|nr:alkaline phosphatase PhoX [Vicinamibacteria bacterium]
MSRRRFLESGLAVTLLPGLEAALGRFATGAPAQPLTRFSPVTPSTADEVVLPEGFRHEVVIRWGDPFTADGRTWGYNNDWVGLLPLGSPEDALLGVNHEYISLAIEGDAPLYRESFQALRGRADTIADWKRDVGLSVLRVRRDERTGAWGPVLGDRLNRRVDAVTPFVVDGPAAAVLGERAEGTFNNCSGQATPWGTFLSCEENFQDHVPEAVDTKGRSPRGGDFDLPGGHYGWVVEVDPHDPASTPRKHTALGRCRHENVAIRAEPGRPVAAYMGDDRTGGHVWKFVSDELYRPGDRESCRRLLRSGALYAARFEDGGGGEWRRLDLATELHPNPDPRDLKPALPPFARTLGDVYEGLGAALADAYQAANCIGATPAGRPEDLEVHPGDGSVFIAFTAVSGRPGLFENVYGEIWRLEEEGRDASAKRFRWTRFAGGGPADASRAGRVFAQPDNMLFDPEGNLWVCTDMSSSRLNQRADYLPFANNGLFLIPTRGESAGRARQLASIPCEAESCGPALTPDGGTLFLSIQHPGERFGIRKQAGAEPRGSNWPEGGLRTPPRPSLIAIRRS